MQRIEPFGFKPQDFAVKTLPYPQVIARYLHKYSITLLCWQLKIELNPPAAAVVDSIWHQVVQTVCKKRRDQKKVQFRESALFTSKCKINVFWYFWNLVALKGLDTHQLQLKINVKISDHFWNIEPYLLVSESSQKYIWEFFFWYLLLKSSTY